MIESFNDLLSLAAVVIMLLGLFNFLYHSNVSSRADIMQKREAEYYKYYEELDDAYDDEDLNGIDKED